MATISRDARNTTPPEEEEAGISSFPKKELLSMCSLRSRQKRSRRLIFGEREREREVQKQPWCDDDDDFDDDDDDAEEERAAFVVAHLF